MSKGHEIPIAEVMPTAKKLLDELGEHCVEIQVAGSIRRGRPYVRDIEIVAIPIRPFDLFGELDESAPTELDELLSRLQKQRRIRLSRNGNRWKRFNVTLRSRLKIDVDLFLTTPERWPVALAIRTGPADYSKAIVTSRAAGGLLQTGCTVRDLRLRRDGRLVELRDERHFFDFVQGGWLEPAERMTAAR